ncbi:MAG: sigma-70 family RNA polymerase sigma factor [Eubacterium sp.]|nr:sigma-70 family RNA polymerase sigma factor [Eubacterium sp.]
MVINERDKTIIENIGLVHSVANRFRNRGTDYDDLFQAGCVGLIKAVDNFDSTMGYKFSTYAVPVIMGEIKRIFRDGGILKVSRSVKEKCAFVQKVREKFIFDNQREPTLSELSEISNIKYEELSELSALVTVPVSLSYDSDDDTAEYDIPIDISDDLFNRLTVDIALKMLNSKERRLITLRFFEGKTQSETAALLSISQVQVSRLEKATLIKLKTLLGSQV